MSFEGTKGDRIQGVQLHLVQQHPVSDKDTQGYLVEKEFVSAGKPCYTLAEQIPLESVITVIYNKRGKVEDLILVDSPSGPKK